MMGVNRVQCGCTKAKRFMVRYGFRGFCIDERKNWRNFLETENTNTMWHCNYCSIVKVLLVGELFGSP